LTPEKDRLFSLREHLKEICKERGPIPFALYMEICLYHPELGYYFAPRAPMGKGGDYITYPQVHPAFGRCMARQVMEIWEQMGSPQSFELVEVGPGKGQMMRDMLELISSKAPLLMENLEVTLVEVSPMLQSIQRANLAQFPNVRWEAPADFFSRRKVRGCILSNELVDSLPVHLVEMRGGELREVLVLVGDRETEEVLGELTDHRIREYLETEGAHLQEGQRVEVGLKALEWIRSVGASLEKGAVITVDFGFRGAEAFHPSRSGGSLMTYRGHRASSDPYELPGGQDICSHVNFSALIRAGEEVGLAPTGIITQDKFLLNLGLLEEMAEQEKRRSSGSQAEFWQEKLALRSLMMPQHPQGGFQVLIQHKGWTPRSLTGLSHRLPQMDSLEPLRTRGLS
jgi:SAM-dependent MidA family methyltransferase